MGGRLGVVVDNKLAAWSGNRVVGKAACMVVGKVAYMAVGKVAYMAVGKVVDKAAAVDMAVGTVADGNQVEDKEQPVWRYGTVWRWLWHWRPACRLLRLWHGGSPHRLLSLWRRGSTHRLLRLCIGGSPSEVSSLRWRPIISSNRVWIRGRPILRGDGRGLVFRRERGAWWLHFELTARSCGCLGLVGVG